MNEICGDDRFELIAKAKQKLLDATNIDSRADEIAVLDSILFRCWQIGLLDLPQLRSEGGEGMSEFIINSEQLKVATEAYLEHELSRPITEVFVRGDKLPEIVRCRDCKEYIEFKDYATCGYFGGDYAEVKPDGFCAWGKRRVVMEEA